MAGFSVAVSAASVQMCLVAWLWCLTWALFGVPASAHSGEGGRRASLDDFIGFPHRNSLVGVTVAGKDRVAWVETQRGVTNLVAADEADGWETRQLTNFTSDDGSGVDFMEFTPDGQMLVFVAGPTADVNANHLKRPPAAATYVAKFNSAAETLAIANESAVSLARDGKGILYVTTGTRAGVSATLWEKPLDLPAPPAKLFSVKQGGLSGFMWQPSGDLLAFANDRGDHGFVGLFSPTSASLLWLPASVDTDLQPVWSPRGRSLAWVRARLPAGNKGFSPFDGNMGNRGPDFSIMAADVDVSASGTPSVRNMREVFRDDKFGMLSFGYGERPLAWANDTTIVFGTEALSSWGHAVVVDLAGAALAPLELRAGPCEDSSWSVGRDGWVYLANNCADIDGIGLERVRLADRQREVIATAGGEPAVSGMASAGYGFVALSGHVALLGSTHDSPTNVYLWSPAAEGLRRITRDTGFACSGFAKPQQIQFASLDRKFTLHAQLFMPNRTAAPAAGSLPGVVYTHGGSERQTYPAFHYDAGYAQHYAANQWMASQGYAVLSVNYRSGTGYGHDFRICRNCMERGAAEYQDVRAAALRLASEDAVDADRIGIWGLSYGGLNAEQACARDSGLFKACVAIAGIFNWVSANRYFTDTGLRVYDLDEQPAFPSGFRSLPTGPEPAWAGPGWAAAAKALQALMLESSPAGHVENLTSPMLLIHGDADEEVEFQETIGAVRAVRALGRDNIRVLTYPDESHGMSTYRHQMQSVQATGDFLAGHLHAASPPVPREGATALQGGDVWV